MFIKYDLCACACLQVLDASSYATLEAARHSGGSSAAGLSAVAPPPKGVSLSFLPAAGGSGAAPPPSFEEDEPMHSASVSTDAARSQRSGIEVVARPHDASPSKDAIVPATGGPRDPLAGDAEWPASVPDGPRFVAFTLRCACLGSAFLRSLREAVVFSCVYFSVLYMKPVALASKR